MVEYKVLIDGGIGGVPYYSRNRRDWIPAGVNWKLEKGQTYELAHWNTAAQEIIKAHSNMPVEVLDYYGDPNSGGYYYYITNSMAIPISYTHILSLERKGIWCDIIGVATASNFIPTKTLDDFDQDHIDSVVKPFRGAYSVQPFENESNYGAKTKCPRCGHPAYEGLSSWECSNGCK